ncbi:solute carrier family 35 member G1-like [Bradysia coprophila]|uniref:solute carrier family 35 member G1-like n=1 Tax=Bradysia coprophila TaxID=38358 RepID=UPI00187DCF05|nr:solute carrier family 35 member G1-like [Bradysia coprophila]XP_037035857.1 solute carrier family 35 member G1-like [Bradysia coprophila]
MASIDNKSDVASVQKGKNWKDAETGNDDHKLQKDTFFKKFGGMLMALAASFFFSVSFLIVKILGSHGFKAFGCSVLFNLGVIVPCLIGILWHEKGPKAHERCSLFKEIWPLSISSNKTALTFLVLQGTLQGLSVILRSFSLRYMTMGDMTVIVFSSPVVTNFIAHFLVGEPCGIFFVFTAILTLCGVGLITKPPFITGSSSFDHNTLIGSALAVGAMLCLSTKFAVTRKIKETHYLLMTLFLGGCGFLISFPLFLAFEDISSIVPKRWEDYVLVGGLLSAFFSIACINLALKNEDAGPVALIRSCDVIFAFLFQYIFLSVVPDTLSGIGAAIVVSGVFLTGLRKWMMTRSAKDESD